MENVADKFMEVAGFYFEGIDSYDSVKKDITKLLEKTIIDYIKFSKGIFNEETFNEFLRQPK